MTRSCGALVTCVIALSGCGLVIDLDPPEQDGATGSCVRSSDCGDGCVVCREGACIPAAGIECNPRGLCTFGEYSCASGSPICEAPLDSIAPAGRVCRRAEEPCDVDEVCDGTSNVCPPDGYAGAGTECRGRAGACDLVEVCSGVSASCPPDEHARMGAICQDGGVCSGDGPSDDECVPCEEGANCILGGSTCERGAQRCPEGDLPYCEGTDEPRDPGEECRAAADVCDLSEICDGSNLECPDDALVASDTECRARVGPCDKPERCTGTSPACPGDAFELASTVCGALAGPCDVVEECTGVDPFCPADVMQPATFVCRASAGPCDADETCDGSEPECPADARRAGDPCGAPLVHSECDLEEHCSSDSAECPANAFQVAGTPCDTGAGAGVCDGFGGCAPCVAGTPCSTGNPCEHGTIVCGSGAATCMVTGRVLLGTPCRPAAGPCDFVDQCGESGGCPADALAPAGTSCGMPMRGPCDVLETCDGVSALCPPDAVQPSDYVCRPSAGVCDRAERCNGTGTACPADATAADGTVCRGALGVCDVAETCDGSVNCPSDTRLGAATICGPALDDCDVPETCGSNGPDCAGDVLAPDGSRCGHADCGDLYQCSDGDCQRSGPLADPCPLLQFCCEVEGCVLAAVGCALSL